MARYRKRSWFRNHVKTIISVLLVLVIVALAASFVPKLLRRITEASGKEAAKTAGESAPVSETLPPPPDPVVVAPEVWTDALASQDEIRSYSFELTGAADVVVLVSGLQEEWDGSPYHWRCTVTGDDPDTPLADAKVRGCSVDDGPAVLSLPKLSAGTYAIHMASITAANPLMTAFTADSYEITLLLYDPDLQPVYGGGPGGVETFQKAGELLWAFDGTGFVKLHDGECFGALMRTDPSVHAVVPVLIGKEPASVEYVVSSTGQYVKAKGPWHCKELDADFYYSDCRYVNRYTEEKPDTSSLPMLYMDHNVPTYSAEDMIKARESAERRQQLTATQLWWEDHGGKVKVALGVAAVLFLLTLFKSSGGGGVDIGHTGSLTELISEFMSDGM